MFTCRSHGCGSGAGSLGRPSTPKYCPTVVSVRGAPGGDGAARGSGAPCGDARRGGRRLRGYPRLGAAVGGCGRDAVPPPPPTTPRARRTPAHVTARRAPYANQRPPARPHWLPPGDLRRARRAPYGCGAARPRARRLLLLCRPRPGPCPARPARAAGGRPPPANYCAAAPRPPGSARVLVGLLPPPPPSPDPPPAFFFFFQLTLKYFFFFRLLFAWRWVLLSSAPFTCDQRMQVTHAPSPPSLSLSKLAAKNKKK